MADLTEAKTRTELVDPLLRAAGWRVVDYQPERTLAEYDGCAVRGIAGDSGDASRFP